MSKSGETHFSHIDQPIEYIRYLMMLTKNRPEPEVSNQISKALCYMFCRPNGLAHLVAAILDLDASSQRTTTHEQRFDAIGTVIAGLPSLDRSIQQYYSNICLQLIRFMKPIDERNVTDHLSQDTRNSLRTLAVTVCCALFKRRCRLFTQTFLRPLFECLEKGQIELSVICIDQNTTTPNLYHSNATISASSAIAPTCMLYIHEAIEIVSILLVRRFPIEPFVPQFAQLFYFYVTLHSTLSHLKGFLGTICEQLLSETPHSVLMLDDALFNQRHIEQAASYRVDRQSNQITLKVISKEFNDEQSQHQVDNKLQRVDCIVQCCSQLIRIFAVEQVIELFLLLLQRLCNAKRWQPDDDRRLILYSLIDSLQEQVLTTIIEHPTKAIIFINVTLDRIADSDLNDLVRFKSIELNDEPESGEAERAAEEDLHFNSMQMCLQLIESLLDKQVSCCKKSKSHFHIQTNDNGLSLISLTKANKMH